MKDKVLDFLRELETRVPPTANRHHAISYAKHGCNKLGWKHDLSLQVNVDGSSVFFYLDEDDFQDTDFAVSRIIAKMPPTQESKRTKSINPVRF
jgi:hypothetical protein